MDDSILRHGDRAIGRNSFSGRAIYQLGTIHRWLID